MDLPCIHSRHEFSLPLVSSMSNQQRSRISDKEMNELVAKLQSLLPESRRRNLSRGEPSSSTVLKETCSYIKSLHREVDDLSSRLSHLISTVDPDGPQADIIRSLFRP